MPHDCIGGSGVQLMKVDVFLLMFSADQLWYSIDHRQGKLYFGKQMSLKFSREIHAKSIYFDASMNDHNQPGLASKFLILDRLVILCNC